MSTTAPSTMEKLRLAIHGVTAPFSCEGTCLPQHPKAAKRAGPTRKGKSKKE